MHTISQVAKMTGISIRTLQYYDKIGLLKPTKLTQSDYRLYDDEALQKLQQILFFKELGFRLKEISTILSNPDFDKITAYKRQKELLLLKRNRINRLIQLLSRLEKGEECMSFKEFDLSDYIEALENFKNSSTDEVIKYWGSVSNFDMFVRKIKEDESKVARLAIQEFGSVEEYTRAMKYNLEHFSEIMEKQLSQIPEEMKQGDLFQKLVSTMDKEASSNDVQQIVSTIVEAAAQHMKQFQSTPSGLLEAQSAYCKMIIDTYSGDYVKTFFNTKNGEGASDFIVKAFRYYAGCLPLI